jgi:hypothetical protein
MEKSLKREFKHLVKNLKKQSILNSKRDKQHRIMMNKLKKLKMTQNILYHKLGDLSKLVIDK